MFSYDVATSKQIEVVVPENYIVFLCFSVFLFLFFKKFWHDMLVCWNWYVLPYCYSVHYFIVIVIVVILVGLCHYLFCESLMGLGARPLVEAFREDCARIWGNLYDYSMTKYQENRMGIPWISWCFFLIFPSWGLCWMCCYNTETVCTHWISQGRNSCQEISTAWWPMNFRGAFPRTTTPQCWLVVPCTVSFGCVRGITYSVAWGAPSVAVPSPEASMAQPPLCWRRFRKRHGWGSTCSSPMRWQMPSLGQLLDPLDLDLVDGWLRLVWELGSWPVLCWEDLSALVWWVLRWMRRYWRKAGQRMGKHENLIKFTTCPESQVVVVSNIPQWNVLI